MASTLQISVKRQDPVLVTPSEPTPHEFKPLSDLDDHESFRHQTPILAFYRRHPLMEGRDPAVAVKAALARLLVHYYPFAGRIREGPGRKLIVETTGEGVVFTEADSDGSLDDFGELRHPFPFVEELLYDVPGTDDVVGGALLLIQVSSYRLRIKSVIGDSFANLDKVSSYRLRIKSVIGDSFANLDKVTRLTCGGFIFGLRMNHAMCDGCGIGQFMIALGQLARGATVPALLPVWDRHLLMARDPPLIKFPHPEYPVGPTGPTTGNMIEPVDNLGDKIERSFFFGSTEIGALRSQLPPRLSNCGLFELLAAALWRARIRAMGFRQDHNVNLLCVVNARSRYTPPLPVSYYGNVVAFPTVTFTAGELTSADLGRLVEAVQAAVGSVTDEYMQSVTDHIVANGRPPLSISGSYHMADLTKHGYDGIDFGWGQPVFCGVAKIGTSPGVASFLCSFENGKGEKGVVVPACLPEKVMEKFLEELDSMTHVVPNE